MTYEEFKELVNKEQGDRNLPPLLNALLIEAQGGWDTAHSLAQDEPDQNGSRVHAYLHRREGDLSNANYWYSRAGVKMPQYDLDIEWENIAKDLLVLYQ